MNNKTTTTTKSKLMQIWTQTPEAKEEKKLEIELKAAELSAREDLFVAEKKVYEQEAKLLSLEQLKDREISKVGNLWSPADIINTEIEIEEAESMLEECKKNVERIKELMKEYL